MNSTVFQVLVVFLVVITIPFLLGFRGKSMNVRELKDAWTPGQNGETILIDVREPDEFSSGHVPGAKNIPLETVARNLDSLKPFKTVYVICLAGGRSAAACQTISRHFGQDKNVINIEGGTSSWISAGYPLEK